MAAHSKGAIDYVAEWIADVCDAVVDGDIEGDCDGERERGMVARCWRNKCALRRRRRRAVPGWERGPIAAATALLNSSAGTEKRQGRDVKRCARWE